MHMVTAQTNLQLYAQMMELGYGVDALDLANRAYLFAARATAGILRGSGKPFACHLAGTASAVAGERLDATAIAASLLHAMYQDRIPVPGADSAAKRRSRLLDGFGAGVESLVHEYHAFESAGLEGLPAAEVSGRRTIVIMRLADELDDLVDHGVSMHGKPGEGETVAGSAACRHAQKRRQAPELIRIARTLGASHLLAHLEHWLAQVEQARWPDALRSGEYSSYSVVGAGG